MPDGNERIAPGSDGANVARQLYRRSPLRRLLRVDWTHRGLRDDERASFDHFIDALVAGRIDPYGTWQTHLYSWLDASRSGASDVLRIRYEDLRADTPEAVMRIADWLGLSLSIADSMRVVDRCSLERMRANETEILSRPPREFPVAAHRSGVPLVNSGSVAGWRDRMTNDQKSRFAAFADGLGLMGYPLPALPSHAGSGEY